MDTELPVCLKPLLPMLIQIAFVLTVINGTILCLVVPLTVPVSTLQFNHNNLKSLCQQGCLCISLLVNQHTYCHLALGYLTLPSSLSISTAMLQSTFASKFVLCCLSATYCFSQLVSLFPCTVASFYYCRYYLYSMICSHSCILSASRHLQLFSLARTAFFQAEPYFKYF